MLSDTLLTLGTHFWLKYNAFEWTEALKRAEIISIFKQGGRTQDTNYRPISLISNIAKMVETIIPKKIYNICDKHKFLYEKQFFYDKKNLH